MRVDDPAPRTTSPGAAPKARQNRDCPLPHAFFPMSARTGRSGFAPSWPPKRRNTLLCLDPFHVVQWVMKALDSSAPTCSKSNSAVGCYQHPHPGPDQRAHGYHSPEALIGMATLTRAASVRPYQGETDPRKRQEIQEGYVTVVEALSNRVRPFRVFGDGSI